MLRQIAEIDDLSILLESLKNSRDQVKKWYDKKGMQGNMEMFYRSGKVAGGFSVDGETMKLVLEWQYNNLCAAVAEIETKISVLKETLSVELN